MKRSTFLGFFAAVMAASLSVAPIFATDTDKTEKTERKDVSLNRPLRSYQPAEGFAVVDMFAAMEDGTIDVRYIPKDATEATVWFENKSDKPLSIQLPEVFAGVPTVLAQGAGMGMGGGGMGGGGMGGGMFNIPAGMKARVKVNTVCLEHGKRDPNPKIPYTIIPIEKFTKKAEVIETCRLLANGQISQQVAQAAAWHYTDDMSFPALADKNRIVFRNGYTEKFFSYNQVLAAQQVAGYVANVAEKAKSNESKLPSRYSEK